MNPFQLCRMLLIDVAALFTVAGCISAHADKGWNGKSDVGRRNSAFLTNGIEGAICKRIHGMLMIRRAPLFVLMALAALCPLLLNGEQGELTSEEREEIELIRTIQEGKVNDIQRKIESGMNVNAVLKVIDVTPLMVAAASGQEEMVEVLLANGADIDLRTYSSPVSFTPIMMAANKEDQSMVKLLLKRGAGISDKFDTDNERLSYIRSHPVYRKKRKEFLENQDRGTSLQRSLGGPHEELAFAANVLWKNLHNFINQQEEKLKGIGDAKFSEQESE